MNQKKTPGNARKKGRRERNEITMETTNKKKVVFSVFLHFSKGESGKEGKNALGGLRSHMGSEQKENAPEG